MNNGENNLVGIISSPHNEICSGCCISIFLYYVHVMLLVTFFDRLVYDQYFSIYVFFSLIHKKSALFLFFLVVFVKKSMRLVIGVLFLRFLFAYFLRIRLFFSMFNMLIVRNIIDVVIT